MQQRKSVIIVNLAVLLFGLAGLFAKWVSVPAAGITFGRVFFSSITLLIFLKVTGCPMKISRKEDRFLLILSGGVLALHWWSFLGAIRLSTVAVGTITFSTFPLFVTFLEPFRFHEQLRPKSVLEAIAILFGVVVTVPSFSFESTYVQGICVGMLSAFLYAVLTLCNKGLSGRYESAVVSFYEQSTAAVVLLPVVFAAGIRPTLRDLSLLLLLGVFTTALAHTLFIGSLKQIPARLAGIISSMETVYSILFAWILLGEVPSARELIGGGIILAVVIFSQLSEKNEP